MPGLVPRGMEMKHTGNALRTILAGGAIFGTLSMSALAAPGDQPNPTDKFKNLEFREIGPATMGGRIDDFAVVESNPNIVYVGTASGGVWKTTNNGTTWEPIFDKEGVSTIGDIAIAPSDPSIVWVGTGEPNNRQSSSWGDGAYKSLDGGKTWKKMGLDATRHIGRIAIHPKNPDVVYVAALGRLWGPNPERGVYKTADGGKTWSHVLKINDDTGVGDIAMDPESPDTLYAAAYERRRTPFGFNGGGPDSAIYKTTDSGANWKKLTKGMPYENGGDPGRIGLDMYRKDPNIVYAIVQHEKGGTYRSEDKGETWKKMGDTNPRPSYYSQIRIDPNNDLRIWELGAPMFYSEDGGKTFSTQRIHGIHGDYHAMWIDPADSNHMLAGSDGGIHWSYDAGKTWDFVNTIAIGQFYEVALDNEKPYHICGGLQDNGSWCGPSQTLTRDGIVNEDWQVIHGGDGFYAAIDNVEPWIVYTESQDGYIDRRDMRTGQQRSIRPEAKAGEPHYRFQWNSPVAVSAHEHTTVYYGGNYLFKSTDRGDNWTRLGGDLTTGVDRNKLQIFGKTPDKNTLSRHDGVQEYPRNANLLFVGTEFGLWVSWDRGANWTALKNNFPTVPVDDIEIQARENDLVLATHGRSIWVLDDLTPIEKMDSNVATSPLTFFPPRPAITWHLRNRRWSAGQKMFTAKNPPFGAILSYYLKDAVPPEAPKKDKDEKDKKDAAEEKPKPDAKGDAAEKKEGKIKITVLDKDGKVIRELDGPGAAGVNRTNWDLRSDPPAEPTPQQLEAIAAGYGFGPRGPFVEPGEYTIKIKAGDKEATQKVMVEDDTRIGISAADRSARREMINQLYPMAKSTDKDRKTIEGIQTALKAAREQWKKDAGKPNTTKIPDDIVKAADELQKGVDAVAEKFIREQQGLGNAGPPFEWKPDPLPNQVQNLLDDLDGFAAAPSAHQKEKLAELTPLVTDASAQVKKIADEDLPALNKKMNDVGIPHIVPAPPQPRGGRGGEEELDQ